MTRPPRGRQASATRGLRVRAAGEGDARKLSLRLRDADLRELCAATGEAPLAALQRGVASSEPCFAVVNERDVPLAIFGVVPDLESGKGQAGIVWMLGSADLCRHSTTFLRHSREWVDQLHESYDLLWNCVDARNTIHIRWLKWCGFRFYRRIETYGVEQRPFLEFARVVRNKRNHAHFHSTLARLLATETAHSDPATVRHL